MRKTVLPILAMLIWVGAVVIAAQFIVSTILLMFLNTEQAAQPLWTAIYSAAVYALSMVLIILVPRKLTKTTRKDLGLEGLPTWMDIGLAPVAYVIATLLAAGLVAIFSLFPWFNANEAQEVGFTFLNLGLDRVIAFITLVVIAPVAEEIIFRGWLYGLIRERLYKKIPEWAGILIATLLVSVLFGAVHGQWNVGVNVFALSIVLCALREITGTIYAGILTHMIKNGVAFFMIYVLMIV